MADRWLTALSRRFVDYLFPPLCIICDEPRVPRDPWLCEQCKKALRENHERRRPCPRCGMNRALGHCACTQGWKQPFESVYSILDFDAKAKEVMHQVKYRGKRRFAVYLGALLAEFVPEEIFSGTDAFIAVPLHRKRHRGRGYNQSLLIARGLSRGRGRGLPLLEGVLLRLRDTASQTKLDRKERERNMRGAFVVASGRAEEISGKRLLLIDDIVTTGATTAAAAKALLDAGCASVRVLSVARD
ncbi:MAG: ComF family protein, partial [Chitinispirillaceae bacterium]|nr:ComF family protein [Chitinispirillaceae bacterium]